jgi:hypothetical protein
MTVVFYPRGKNIEEEKEKKEKNILAFEYTIYV